MAPLSLWVPLALLGLACAEGGPEARDPAHTSRPKPPKYRSAPVITSTISATEGINPPITVTWSAIQHDLTTISHGRTTTIAAPFWQCSGGPCTFKEGNNEDHFCNVPDLCGLVGLPEGDDGYPPIDPPSYPAPISRTSLDNEIVRKDAQKRDQAEQSNHKSGNNPKGQNSGGGNNPPSGTDGHGDQKGSHDGPGQNGGGHNGGGHSNQGGHGNSGGQQGVGKHNGGGKQSGGKHSGGKQSGGKQGSGGKCSRSSKDPSCGTNQENVDDPKANCPSPNFNFKVPPPPPPSPDDMTKADCPDRQDCDYCPNSKYEKCSRHLTKPGEQCFCSLGPCEAVECYKSS